MVVLLVGQAPRQVAGLMVVDIGQRRNAGRLGRSRGLCLCCLADHVADRLGAAAVALRRAQPIHESEKIGVDRDRDAFHRTFVGDRRGSVNHRLPSTIACPLEGHVRMSGPGAISLGQRPGASGKPIV